MRATLPMLLPASVLTSTGSREAKRFGNAAAAGKQNKITHIWQTRFCCAQRFPHAAREAVPQQQRPSPIRSTTESHVFSSEKHFNGYLNRWRAIHFSSEKRISASHSLPWCWLQTWQTLGIFSAQLRQTDSLARVCCVESSSAVIRFRQSKSFNHRDRIANGAYSNSPRPAGFSPVRPLLQRALVELCAVTGRAEYPPFAAAPYASRSRAIQFRSLYSAVRQAVLITSPRRNDART